MVHTAGLFENVSKFWGWTFATLFGITRVKAGTILEHTHRESSEHWVQWRREDEQQWYGDIPPLISPRDDKRPDHPPQLAIGKRRWFFVAGHQQQRGFVQDLRDIKKVGASHVLVFREGMCPYQREPSCVS